MLFGNSSPNIYLQLVLNLKFFVLCKNKAHYEFILATIHLSLWYILEENLANIIAPKFQEITKFDKYST